MKKQLLTTTALVAAGVLAVAGAAQAQTKASKPSLSIGGWVEGIVGVASQDDDVANGVGGRVGWDSQYDSEFLFRGAVTLDNGIRIRSVSELEGEVSGDQWDEVYMAISGSFGELRIGSMDNAAYQAITPISGSWAVQVGQNLALDQADWLVRPAGHAAAGNVRLNIGDNDSNKVNYFTPRVAGFQLALSYLPSFEECVTSGSQDSGCNSSIANTSANPHNGWAAGLTFDRKFDQVRTAVGVGYVTAKNGTTAGPTPVQAGDPTGWSVGALVEWGGFGVSGGYKQERNRTGTNNSLSADIDVLDIAAKYSWGANHVSVGAMWGESPASRAVAGDDESLQTLVSYRRDLGPGVQYRLNFFYADHEGENVGSTDDNEGYAITTSVRVAF
jgi:predicted porin